MNFIVFKKVEKMQIEEAINRFSTEGYSFHLNIMHERYL
jgi:hypothetical protein